MVTEGTQFCIGLDNKPGALARLCSALRQAGVNVDALYISGDEDCCWVNFVANPVAKANEVLVKEGHNYFTERVLVIRVGDEPGELERVSARLAEAGININYIYGSCTNGSCTLVLNAEEQERASEILSAEPRRAE